MFYNKKGYPSAFSDTMNIIFKFDGKPIGYIYQKSIYKFNGTHLGFYIDDWIFDNKGEKVFFSVGAENSPPTKEIYPVIKPKKSLPKKLERKEKPKIPPLSSKWSNLSLEEFFNQ
jgi:hypothetical protein